MVCRGVHIILKMLVTIFVFIHAMRFSNNAAASTAAPQSPEQDKDDTKGGPF